MSASLQSIRMLDRSPWTKIPHQEAEVQYGRTHNQEAQLQDGRTQEEIKQDVVGRAKSKKTRKKRPKAGGGTIQLNTESSTPNTQEAQVQDGRTQEAQVQDEEEIRQGSVQEVREFQQKLRIAMEKVVTRHSVYRKHKKFALRMLVDMDLPKLRKFAAYMGGVDLNDTEREDKKVVLDKVARELMSRNQLSHNVMRGKNIYQEMLEVGASICKQYCFVADAAWDFKEEIADAHTLAEFFMDILVGAKLPLLLMERFILDPFLRALTEMLE